MWRPCTIPCEPCTGECGERMSRQLSESATWPSNSTGVGDSPSSACFSSSFALLLLELPPRCPEMVWRRAVAMMYDQEYARVDREMRACKDIDVFGSR